MTPTRGVAIGRIRRIRITGSRCRRGCRPSRGGGSARGPFSGWTQSSILRRCARSVEAHCGAGSSGRSMGLLGCVSWSVAVSRLLVSLPTRVIAAFVSSVSSDTQGGRGHGSADEPHPRRTIEGSIGRREMIGRVDRALPSRLRGMRHECVQALLIRSGDLVANCEPAADVGGVSEVTPGLVVRHSAESHCRAQADRSSHPAAGRW